MANRLKVAKVLSIKQLHDQGWSQRRIARELGISRERVRQLELRALLRERTGGRTPVPGRGDLPYWEDGGRAARPVDDPLRLREDSEDVVPLDVFQRSGRLGGGLPRGPYDPSGDGQLPWQDQRARPRPGAERAAAMLFGPRKTDRQGRLDNSCRIP